VKLLITKCLALSVSFPLFLMFDLRGAKVLAKDKTGRQALNYASEMGFDDIIY